MPVQQEPSSLANQQPVVSGVSVTKDVHSLGGESPSFSKSIRLALAGRSPVRASNHSPFASPSRLRPESRWRVQSARQAASINVVSPMSASLPSPSSQFSPAEEGILPVGERCWVLDTWVLIWAKLPFPVADHSP
jgi:hypothetical protein